jgi:hypothetical protein
MAANGATHEPFDAVGPIWPWQPVQQVVALLGPGSEVVDCVSEQRFEYHGCDRLRKYSDGKDLLVLDFGARSQIIIIRMIQGRGAKPNIQRLPKGVGAIGDVRYMGTRVFDVQGLKAAEEHWKLYYCKKYQAGRSSGQTSEALFKDCVRRFFKPHFPAAVYQDRSGHLEFTLYEE